MDDLIRQLEATGEYRVLRRLAPRASYGAPDGSPVRRAVAIDVETTGLDAASEAIIELAMVPFDYAQASGVIVAVHPALVWLEDPGRPVPPDVTALTGITDAMVRGRRIDDAAATAALEAASLVLAHNAAFDRPFVDRRLAASQERAWACTMQEVPWKAHGVGSSALEHILMKHCGKFFDGHRADADCLAMLEALATPFADGSLPMHHLLASARQKTSVIRAVNSPIETKDLLKARRYRWDPGTNGGTKAWFREVTEAEREAEFAWLREHVYGGRDGWREEVRTARTRYRAAT